MKKSFTVRQISMIIAALIVRYGMIDNAYNSFGNAVWRYKQHPNSFSLFRIVSDITGSFLSEWLVPLYFGKVIQVLALLFLFVMLIDRVIHRSSLKRHSDPQAAVRAEKKTCKLLFRLSFLPFLLFIVYCFISMFTGADAGFFVSHTVYGSAAFITSFVWVGLALCMIPVFPLIVFYQLFYIIKYAPSKKVRRRQV